MTTNHYIIQELHALRAQREMLVLVHRLAEKYGASVETVGDCITVSAQPTTHEGPTLDLGPDEYREDAAPGCEWPATDSTAMEARVPEAPSPPRNRAERRAAASRRRG